jgi:hypothetical protein
MKVSSKKGDITAAIPIILGVILLVAVFAWLASSQFQKEAPEKVSEAILAGGTKLYVDPDSILNLPREAIALASGDIDDDNKDELVVLGEKGEGGFYLLFFEYNSEEDRIVFEDYGLISEDLGVRPICASDRHAIDLAINKNLEGQDPIYVLRTDKLDGSSEIDDVLKYIVYLTDEDCFEYDKRIRVQTLQGRVDHKAIAADDFSYGIVEHEDSLASFATTSEVYTVDAGNLAYPRDNGRESTTNVRGFCYLNVGSGTWLDISSGDIDSSGTSSMVYVKNDGFTIYYNSDFACATDTSSSVSIEGDFVPIDFVVDGASLVKGDVGVLEFGKDHVYLLDNKGFVYVYNAEGRRKKYFEVEALNYKDITAWHFRGADYVALLREDSVNIYKVPVASGSIADQIIV